MNATASIACLSAPTSRPVSPCNQFTPTNQQAPPCFAWEWRKNGVQVICLKRPTRHCHRRGRGEAHNRFAGTKARETVEPMILEQPRRFGGDVAQQACRIREAVCRSVSTSIPNNISKRRVTDTKRSETKPTKKQEKRIFNLSTLRFRSQIFSFFFLMTYEVLPGMSRGKP